MKMFVMKNKKVRGIVMAMTLGAAPLLTSSSLKAHSVEQEAAEHEQMATIIAELSEYSAQLSESTEKFFYLNGKGNNHTSTDIKNEAQNLVQKINQIKEKCTQSKASFQLIPHKKLMALFEKLTITLSASQTKLKNAFQHLGNQKRCMSEFAKLAKTEAAVLKEIEKLHKQIMGLLPTTQKQPFSTYVTHITFSFQAAKNPDAFKSAQRRISTK